MPIDTVIVKICERLLLFDRQIFPRRCLLTPDRGPMTDLNTDNTKVQLGKPTKCIDVSYKNMGKGLLTGAEMTQRQLHHQGPARSSEHNTWPWRAGNYSLENVLSKWMN